MATHEMTLTLLVALLQPLGYDRYMFSIDKSTTDPWPRREAGYQVEHVPRLVANCLEQLQLPSSFDRVQ